MDTKKQVLQGISELSRKNAISRDEVLEAFEEGQSINTPDSSEKIVLSIPTVLSFLGGGIIVLGLVILVGNNWSTLSDFMKIFCTLGIAVILHIAWYTLHALNKLFILKYVSLFISGILYPIGIFISGDIIGLEVSTGWFTTIAFAITSSLYVASIFVALHPLTAFYAIGYTTLFVYSLYGWVVTSYFPFTDEFLQVFPVAVGVSHLLLASIVQNSKVPRFISPILNLAGSIQIYLAVFVLSFDYEWIDFLYPFLLLAGYYLSVRVTNRIILLASAFFTFLIVFKITSERFSESLGWPISLVIIGLGLIGIGSLTLYINKNYLNKSSNE